MTVRDYALTGPDSTLAADRTYVIVLRTHPHTWTEGGSFWEVGVPEVSASPLVRAAREAMEAGRANQRVG